MSFWSKLLHSLPRRDKKEKEKKEVRKRRATVIFSSYWSSEKEKKPASANYSLGGRLISFIYCYCYCYIYLIFYYGFYNLLLSSHMIV